MKDIPYNDLKTLLEFLYRGSIVVPVEQMASLAKSAKGLHIKGLEKYFNKASSVTPFVLPNGQTTSSSSSKRKRRPPNRIPMVNGNQEHHISSSEEAISSDDECYVENRPGQFVVYGSSNNQNTVRIKQELDPYMINGEYEEGEEGDEGPPQLELQGFNTDEIPLGEDGGIEYDDSPPEMISMDNSPRQSRNEQDHDLNSSISNTSLRNLQSIQASSTSKRLTQSAPPKPNQSRILSRNLSALQRITLRNKVALGNQLVRKYGSASTIPSQSSKPEAPEKEISCMICSRTFTKQSSLQLHLKRFHNELEKKFSCNYCDKSYAWRSGLYKHMKTHNI